MHMLTRLVLPALLALASLQPALAQSNADFAAPRFLEGTGSQEADGVFPRTVIDEVDEVVIPAEPKRIAVIQTGQLDGALSLGVIPAGAARGNGTALYGDYHKAAFPQFADQLDAIADLGSRQEPDIEAIAALKPDLIFLNKAALVEDTYNALKQIAPVVVTKGTGVNWKVDFLLLAHALGKAGAAQALLDRYQADAEALAANWADAPPTVSFVHSNGERTRIMGVASFAGSIAEDLGLARPESQNFMETSADISPELLDQADADWIFYSGQGDGIAVITEAPLWSTLSGVAAGHAAFVEYEPFYFNAGPAAARIVLETIGKTIAP
jgi:iron complex transport system substrate-binding protein